MVKFVRGDIVEIERKFIFDGGIDINYLPCEKICQGYISLDPEIRLRKKGERFYRTEKSKGDMVREEREKEISKEEYDLQIPGAKGILIEKIRYYKEYGKHTVEIDIFSGALYGLKICEVEFNTEEEAKSFIPPEWFGAEVTNDSRFKNKNLALKGQIPILED